MICKAAQDLIKKSEGLYLTSYKCPAGVWTIGWGSTAIFGEPVHAAQHITIEQAQAQFEIDVHVFEEALRKAVNPSIYDKMNENQKGSLTCFIYNVGPGNFRSSTLLKKLNAGLFSEVPDQLLKWNRGGGKVLPGLTTRREAEGALFKTP